MEPSDASPRRLVLWRHGETEWNRLGIAQGHANVPLNEVGVAQAQRAAPFLASYEPTFIWSSDLARARETAVVLADVTGTEVMLDDRLREFGVGARQGLTFEQFQAKHPDLFVDSKDSTSTHQARWQVPGAEDPEAVRRRMFDVLTEAAEALQPGQTGVLVGHGASLRVGLLAFFRAPDGLREMLAGMANCAWAVLEQHQHRGWQIIDYNAQTLPPPLELADDLSSP